MANTNTSDREKKHTHYYSSNPYIIYKVQRKVSYTLVRTKAIENVACSDVELSDKHVKIISIGKKSKTSKP